MATEPTKEPRKVSVTVTIFVPSMSQEDANAFENAIRDAADDFTDQVNVSRGNPINAGA